MESPPLDQGSLLATLDSFRLVNSVQADPTSRRCAHPTPEHCGLFSSQALNTHATLMGPSQCVVHDLWFTFGSFALVGTRGEGETSTKSLNS